jgi:hypothetical protein
MKREISGRHQSIIAMGWPVILYRDSFVNPPPSGPLACQILACIAKAALCRSDFGSSGAAMYLRRHAHDTAVTRAGRESCETSVDETYVADL